MAYYAERLRGPPRVGPRLVQRRAAGRPLGERGVRLVLRRWRSRPELEGDRPAGRADPGARGGQDPAQQLGRDRARDERGRGLRLCRDAGPGQGDRGARRARRAASGLGGRGRPDRGLPAAGCPAARRRTGRRPSMAAARLAGSARPARRARRRVVRRPVADVGRPPDGPAAARRAAGGPPALRRGRSPRPADWQLPRPIRDAMRAWRFDTATALLDGRDADPRPADGDRGGGRGRRADAAGDAARRLRAPGRVRQRGRARPPRSSRRSIATTRRRPRARRRRTSLQTLGLWGATPDAELAQSRTLFAAGDLAGAATAAGGAAGIWISAEEVGRGRLVSIAALTSAVLLGLVLFGAWLRGRRRRHRALAPGWVSEDPYATLAATPGDPATPDHRGADRD